MDAAPSIDNACNPRLPTLTEIRCMSISTCLARATPALLTGALLSACASTTVSFQPAAPEPLCEPSATAVVFWATRWRADQKDVTARESAAATGLSGFFASTDCFAQTQLRRVDALPPSPLPAAPDSSRLIGIEVLELGPVVKLLSSAALVDGGTEVVFRAVRYPIGTADEPHSFIVQWRQGGPGVVKGVASLPQDMRAALQAGLMAANGAASVPDR